MGRRYDPDRHHRQSIRLTRYDYRQAGAYFVTMCTCERECVLDDPIVRGILTDVWRALPERFPTIALDAFVAMPNHVHLIVWLHPPSESQGAGDEGDVGATLAVARTDTAGQSNDVGATLAVARTTTTDQYGDTDWMIPEPQKVNVSPTLGDVIGAFKSLVFVVYLNWVERHDPTRRAKFWQRNYYEHVIHNDRELEAIRQYIADNPDRWVYDT